MADDACRHDVMIALPPARAFDRFVADFDGWWPQEFSWAQEGLDAMVVEPHVGGRLIERDKSGSEIVWGQVLEIAPPARLVFSWQISPAREALDDPAQASVVEVGFTADGDGTRVTLEHRDFARHGDGWPAYRDMLAAQGWPFALARYAAP